jgi:hypothetical protein
LGALRTKMLRRIPTDLPPFGALLLGLSLVAFGYTGMFTELALGRPSSTSSVGFLFVPLWGVLASIVGVILGLVVRAIWRRTKGPEAESDTSALLVTLTCAVVAAAGFGAFNVIQYEQEAKPRIRLDDGQLVREFRTDSEKAVRASTTLYDSDDKSEVLSWGTNRSELLVDDDHVVLRDTVSGKDARFSTSALDYTTRVDAVPVLADPGPSLLTIVISGRATGRRAIIAAVDQNYKVVFEEQVERFWQLDNTPVEVRVDPAMGEYVVVGPHAYQSLILKRKPQR